MVVKKPIYTKPIQICKVNGLLKLNVGKQMRDIITKKNKVL